MKLRVLDLFSGIGGFSLGLERTGGFETVAFCEIEDYPRRVLAKHWPKVPIYHDVRELTADTLRRDGIAVDVICGGFPCQDVSFAGKRAGLEGARSGLWREYARLVGELRPRFVIVENVPGLLNLGMGAVLGDLAARGYDATWDCIPAAAVGAPHRRDRVWIVAHTDSPAVRQQSISESRRSRKAVTGGHSASANANGESKHAFAVDAEVEGASEPNPNASPVHRASQQRSEPDGNHGSAEALANAESNGRKPRRARDASQIEGRRQPSGSSEPSHIRNANVSGLAFRQGQSRDVGEEFAPSVGADWWELEPDVGRVAHGVPSRVDRLRCLGNAVVPQIPELIGRAILQAEGLAA